MKTLKQLLEERAAKQAELRALQTLATTEKRDLTTDEATQAEALVAAITSLNDEIRAKERAQTLTASIATALGGTNGGSGGEGNPGHIVRNIEPGDDSARDIVNNPDPRRYSILRAINARVEGRAVDGYEGEISQEISRRMGRNPQGFFFPTNLPMRADASAGRESRDAFGVSAGSNFIPTILDTSRFIDTLRASTFIYGLGAQVINNVVGALDLPKLGSNVAYTWNGESASGDPSVPSTAKVSFAAKTLAAKYIVTRRMTMQTSLDVENLFRRNAMKTLALAIDETAIKGSGSGNTPQGLLANTDIPVVSLGTNGAAPTWAMCVGLETAINNANAMAQDMAYVTSQSGRGILKQTTRVASSTFGDFLWHDDNTINGYKAVSSTLVPNNLSKGTSNGVLTSLIFGNWADLYVALWGGIDVIVDPFTQGNGDVLVTMLQDADMQVGHAQSFAICKDMTR